MVGRAIVRLLFTAPNAGPRRRADKEIQVEPCGQLVQEPAAQHFGAQHQLHLGPSEGLQRLVTSHTSQMDNAAQRLPSRG